MLPWLHKLQSAWQAHRAKQRTAAHDLLTARYQTFRALLAGNNRAIDILTEISIHLRLQSNLANLALLTERLIEETGEMVARLEHLAVGRYGALRGVHHGLAATIRAKLAPLARPEALPHCLALAALKPEHRALTGNKAASLAALNTTGARVPDGFVITLPGCRFFLEHQGLALQLTHVLAKQGAHADQAIPPATARQVQDLIMKSPLPPALAEDILTRARPFFQNGGALAVRSSSISEDGERHSFAGQFSSVLNVRNEEQVLAAFREVVASNFTARSLAYRLHAGLDPLSFEMAVLCLEMVDARAAGILLTRSPQDPAGGMMLVSAVPGLGEAAVAGSAAADLYLMNRDGEVDWRRSTIAAKERSLVSVAEGGVRWRALDPQARRLPVLDAAALRELAALGNILEARQGLPLDLEWAVDGQGRVVVLQIRPLTAMGQASDETWQAKTPPLAQGCMASGGRATGRVLLVKSRRDLEALPPGPVVLVMPQSFVDAAGLLNMVAAVLVELGSPADHLACVAREQGIPLICGLSNAGGLLTDGQWLTVDGSHGLVYAATEEEISAAQEAAGRHEAAACPLPAPLPPLQQELRRLITALHLTDAYGPTFSILECRSLHDIIRFIHEKAVLAMFEAGDEVLEGNLGGVHILDSSIPFFVSVIDMGGGLTLAAAPKRRIPAEMVIARPFQALWRGVTTPGLHWGPPPGGTPMGSVISTFLTDQKSQRPIGMPNYCLVSRDYCNMNARMDFHFIMIDTVCGPETRSNHIRFRFKGGGTSLPRRRRRAQCIGEIFEHYGFLVDVKEDLVNASLQAAGQEVIEEKLVVVGRILGFTRLLDAVMGEDRLIGQVSRAFIAGDYGLTTLEPPPQA
jgi:pyruvate,water dikinase